VPGANRPWSIEPEELNQPEGPLDSAFGGPPDEARGELPEIRVASSADAGRAPLSSRVSESDVASTVPQFGQNRLPSATDA